MLGLMIVANDDDLSMMVVPDPDNPLQLLVFCQFGDLEFPPIPIYIPDLKQVLEVLDGIKKTLN